MRRNDPDTFVLTDAEPLPADPSVIVAALRPLVTAERYARIEKVALQRLGSVTVVLDRLTDPHNVSAVLRSADAFGVPSMHVIPERTEFRAAQGVTKGTQRWVDVHVHADVNDCAAKLQHANYGIFVASMNAELALEDIAQHQAEKIALVFGNEHRGPDPEWRQYAKGFFSIPMKGFVESLNVSVAAAISIFTVTSARASASANSAAATETLARYLMRSVTNPERALDQYLNSKTPSTATPS